MPLGDDNDAAVRLRVIDETKQGVDSAAANLKRFTDEAARGQKAMSDTSKAYSDAMKLAAQSTGLSVQQIKLLSDTSKGAAAAARDIERGLSTLERTTDRVSRHVGTGIVGLSAKYLTLAAVIHQARKAFVGFADFDTTLRRLQNQAGSTRAEIDALIPTFKSLSRQSGFSTREIVKGFDTIRENANLSLKQAEELLTSMVVGAEAAGVSVKEMSEAFASMMLNMEVKGTDASAVMDIIAKASADMKIDVGEMVRQMPRMTEIFGEMGYTGKNGVINMIAWASSLRGVTKNSGEAAQAIGRMLENISGGQIGHALDIPQERILSIVEAAKASGKDVIDVFVHMINSSGRAEEFLSKISARERRYWREVLKNQDAARESVLNLTSDSTGAALRFADNIRKGPGKAINDLKNEWTNLGDLLVKGGASIGITEALRVVSRLMQSITALSRIVRKGEYWRLNPFDPRNVEAEKQRKQAEIDRGNLEHAFDQTIPDRDATPEEKAAAKEFRERYKPGGPGMNMIQRFADTDVNPLGLGDFTGERSSIWDLSGEGSTNIEDRRGEDPVIASLQRRDENATKTLTYEIRNLIRTLEDLKDWQGGGSGPGGAITMGDVQRAVYGGGGGAYSGVAQRFAGGGGGDDTVVGPVVNTPSGPVDVGTGRPISEMTEGMVSGPAGTAVPAGGTVQITSPSGRKFTVAREYAANFQGFINDYENAGGVIGPDSGGLAGRGNKSYHPRGMAIDLNQTGYGIRSRHGKTLPQATEDALAAKWGLFPGSQFKSRSDIGHFEVRNRAAARAAIERNQAAQSVAPSATPATPGSSLPSSALPDAGGSSSTPPVPGTSGDKRSTVTWPKGTSAGTKSAYDRAVAAGSARASGSSESAIGAATGNTADEVRRAREEAAKASKPRVDFDMGGATRFGRAAMQREAENSYREAGEVADADIGAA